MNNTLEPVRLKFRTPILLIALLGLGAVLLSHLLQLPDFLFNLSHFTWLMLIIGIFRDLSYALLYTAVFIPFLLYVFSTHKKGKGPLYMTLTLACLLLLFLSFIFWSFLHAFLYGYGFSVIDLSTIIMYLVEAFCFGVPLLMVVLKLRNKVLPIIALGFNVLLLTLTMLGSILNLFLNAESYFDFEYTYAFSNLCNTVSGIDRMLGIILLLVAMIFLIATNDIFAKPQPKAVDPADALRALQAQLDAGTITEEAYQAQRAEIIANL